jgi:hypothetical protein
MENLGWILLAAGLGVLGRTLLPYLQVLRDYPDTPFDRKFLLPAVVSAIIAVIALPLILGGLPDTIWVSSTPQGYILVFVSAWGMTDITRLGQKQSEPSGAGGVQ